jgi:hypothetical protein
MMSQELEWLSVKVSLGLFADWKTADNCRLGHKINGRTPWQQGEILLEQALLRGLDYFLPTSWRHSI